MPKEFHFHETQFFSLFKKILPHHNKCLCRGLLNTNQTLMKLTRVDELIDPNTGGWDEQLVRDTFQEEEAEAILTIPNEEGMLNWLAWHFDSKGLFSTYKLAVQISDNEAGRTAGTSAEWSLAKFQCPWHKIWQLKVPNKIQMFFWRFVHNSLPVWNNLKRSSKTETICSMCNRF